MKNLKHLVLFCIIFLNALNYSIAQNYPVTHNELLVPGTQELMVNFKLPYEGSSVQWTGGPHQYANTNIGSQYPTGLGSGLDFSGGAFEVLSMASGYVVEAECGLEFGCQVAIQHIDQTVLVYGHLQTNSFSSRVTVDQWYPQGTPIGIAGQTGTDNVHLHVELRDGQTCNISCMSGGKFGNPIGWGDLVPFVDGYRIGSYLADSEGINSYNYDGSAIRYDTPQILYNFKYMDWIDTDSTIQRTAIARVHPNFVCINSENCEDNDYHNLTQFAGGGHFGTGGAPSSQPVLQTVNNGGGYLVSTNAPSGGSIDTLPPTGSWISPTNGSTITSNTVTLGANASDNSGGSGVAEVRFSAKWNNEWHGVGEDASYPYSVSWDMCTSGVPDGDIELGMEVWDNANNVWIYSQHYTNIHINKSHNCSTTPPPPPEGDWVANYYESHDFWNDLNNPNRYMCSEGLSGPNLDRNYGSSAPCGGMSGDNWVGDYHSVINFPAGHYYFEAGHDDGMRLWIGGQRIFERSSSSSNAWHCELIYLNGDYNVRVMLREESGDARVHLRWATSEGSCVSNGATVWAGDNYTGDSRALSLGTHRLDWSPYNFNDQTQSVSVAPNWSIMVFRESNFRGVVDCYSGNRSRLPGEPNDPIWDLWRQVTDVQVFNAPNCPQSQLMSFVMYERGDLGGPKWGVGYQPGLYNLTDIPRNRVDGINYDLFNDRASSFSVPMGWSVIVYEHNDGQGVASQCFSERNVVSSELGYLDNKISSVRIFDNTNCVPTPDAPTPTSPSSGATVERTDSVTLTWNAVSGASAYYVEIWSDYTNFNSGWIAGTSWNAGIIPGGSYQWRVMAQNGSANSDWSSTQTLDVKYGAPSNLRAININDTSVEFNWNNSIDDPYNIAGYHMYRNGLLVGTFSTGSAPWTDTTAACDTTYDYTLRAYKNALESNASNTVSLTTYVCDNVEPTGTMVYPLRQSYQSETPVFIELDANDNAGGSGIDRVDFYAYSTEIWSETGWVYLGTDTTFPYSMYWDISSVQDGFVWINATIFDNAGNSYTLSGDAEWTYFHIDRTNGNCSEIWPVDKVELHSGFTCSGPDKVTFTQTGLYNLSDYSFDNTAMSIYVGPSYSVRIYEGLAGTGASRCVFGSFWYLTVDYYADATPIVVDGISTVSSIEVFNNPSCTVDTGISGTVYDTDGVTPVSGASIRVIDPANNNDFIWETTDSNGNYTIETVSGNYYVRVYVNNRALEFWDDVKTSIEDATLVSVQDSTITPNIDFTLDPAGTISGTVRDSIGNPLPNMAVDLIGPWISACTDQNGNYTLNNVPLDVPYVVTVKASTASWCSNTPAGYGEQFWDTQNQYADATPITLTSGTPNVTGVDFAMLAGASITGTVQDSSGGVIEFAQVWLYESGTSNELASTCSDAVGNYSFLTFNIGSVDVKAGNQAAHSCMYATTAYGEDMATVNVALGNAYAVNLVLTPDNPPFLTPTLNAPSGIQSAQTPTFQWNAIAGVSAYQISINGAETRLFTISEDVACSGSSTCSFTPDVVDGLPFALTTYNAMIRAANSLGESLWGGTTYFAVSPSINTPSGGSTILAPTESSISSRTPTLEWTPPISGASHYDIYALYQTYSEYITVSAVDANCNPNCSYVLNAQEGYTGFRILPKNYNGYSGWSSARYFFTTAATAVATPPTLANPTGTVNTSTTTITWNFEPGVNRYSIYTIQPSIYGSTFTFIDAQALCPSYPDATTCSFDLNTPWSGTYTVQINARNPFGWSGYGISPLVVDLAPPDTILSAPTWLSDSLVRTDRSFPLAWSEVEGAISYTLVMYNPLGVSDAQVYNSSVCSDGICTVIYEVDTNGLYTAYVRATGISSESAFALSSFPVRMLDAPSIGRPIVDADGDGIDDSFDNCTTIANAEQLDRDGDGIGAACDWNDSPNSLPSVGSDEDTNPNDGGRDLPGAPSNP